VTDTGSYKLVTWLPLPSVARIIKLAAEFPRQPVESNGSDNEKRTTSVGDSTEPTGKDTCTMPSVEMSWAGCPGKTVVLTEGAFSSAFLDAPAGL